MAATTSRTALRADHGIYEVRFCPQSGSSPLQVALPKSADNGLMRRTSDLRCQRAQRRLAWITERVRLFRQRFEMTRHPLAASGRPKLRLLRSAAIEHIWTTCVKAASAGWIDRARHVALQDDRVAGGPWAPEPARPRAGPWCRDASAR